MAYLIGATVMLSIIIKVACDHPSEHQDNMPSKNKTNQHHCLQKICESPKKSKNPEKIVKVKLLKKCLNSLAPALSALSDHLNYWLKDIYYNLSESSLMYSCLICVNLI